MRGSFIQKLGSTSGSESEYDGLSLSGSVSQRI